MINPDSNNIGIELFRASTDITTASVSAPGKPDDASAIVLCRGSLLIT